MGYELLLDSLEIGTTQQPDWEAAERALAALSPKRVTQLYVAEAYDAKPTAKALAQFRARIGTGLQALRDFWEGASDAAAIHDLRDSQVLLFGGTSSGDEPCDGWGEAHLAIAAGLATAAGFWTRPARTGRPRRIPPTTIALDRLRAILARETACIAPEDVGPLMRVIRREAACSQ